MKFKTAKSYLDRLNIGNYVKTEYRGSRPGRQSCNLEIFRTVDPFFRAEDWLKIATRNGTDYIGGCCGQYSSIQDVICSWFRFNTQSIPLDELAEVAEGMISHDGDSSYFGKPPWEWDIEDSWKDWESVISCLEAPYKDGDEICWVYAKPWYKLAIIWNLVKDNYAPNVPGAIRRDMSDLDEALCIVDSVASALSMHRAFGLTDSEQTRFSHTQAFTRFLPALKVVTEQINSKVPEPFKGWAMVDIEKGDDAICQNGHGYCVYGSREDLQKILDIWMDIDAKYEEKPDENRVQRRLGVRPISVGIHLPRGYEFTGPLEGI